MSAEKGGRRWATGALPQHAGDYFDRLISQLESEVPLSEAGATTRYDELAAMRRALHIATSTRSIGAYPARSVAPPAPPMHPPHPPPPPPGYYRCTAAVTAILDGALYAPSISVATPAPQPPAVPAESSGDRAKGRAELALRRRGVWSGPGEQAACQLLSRWTGAFQNLPAVGGKFEVERADGPMPLWASAAAVVAKPEARAPAPAPSEPPPPAPTAAAAAAVSPSEEEAEQAARLIELAPADEGPSLYAALVNAGAETADATESLAGAASRELERREADFEEFAEQLAWAHEQLPPEPRPTDEGSAASSSAQVVVELKVVGTPDERARNELAAPPPAAAAAAPPPPGRQRTRGTSVAAKWSAAHGTHAPRPLTPRRRERWLKVVAMLSSRRAGRDVVRFVDIVNGAVEFHIGRTATRYDGSLLIGPAVPEHGIEVVKTLREALSCTYPLGSRHLRAPRALLEVMVGGQPRIVDGRIYFVQVTPVKVLADPYQFAQLHRELFGDEYYLPATSFGASEAAAPADAAIVSEGGAALAKPKPGTALASAVSALLASAPPLGAVRTRAA